MSAIFENASSQIIGSYFLFISDAFLVNKTNLCDNKTNEARLIILITE